MRYAAGVLTGFILSVSLAWGANISSPPPLQEKENYLYLREIWNNLYNMPVVTTAPNGVRRGRLGDFLLLSTGGNYYLEVNVSPGTDGGTTWVGEQLTTVP